MPNDTNQNTTSVVRYQPPGVGALLVSGPKANIWRYPSLPRVVVKAPNFDEEETKENVQLWLQLSNEKTVLRRISNHWNIVAFIDLAFVPRSILLSEAKYGSLQQYLVNYGSLANKKRRLQWCLDVARGLAFSHNCGVRHGNLHPTNLLVDENLSIRICGWSGAAYNTDVRSGLPEPGFYDPRDKVVNRVDVSTEIFALGSLMYYIATGHLPHGKNMTTDTPAGLAAYGEKFAFLINRGIMPEMKGVVAGDIILDCWKRRIPFAVEARERLVAAKA